MRTVFKNGIIYRDRHATNFATCDTMVINNDRIEYLGNDADRQIPELIFDEEILSVDLKGQSVFSSFVDGHMHLLLYGASMLKVGLDFCESLADIRSTISQAAKDMPNAQRILCRGWRQSTTHRQASANMIDDIDPRPIYIDADDLHSAWCNSAALKEMEITRDTTDPVDGTIERDSNGEPTGLISEGAVISMIWPRLIGFMSKKEKVACIQAAIEEYHETGYTAVIEMAMEAPIWELLEELHVGGKLGIRIAAHWFVGPTLNEEQDLAQVQEAINLHNKYNLSNSPDFRIAGIKVICDGVVDSCTAALSTPYIPTPHGSGQLNWTDEALRKVVAKADEAGLQVACHAIGDAAVHQAINVLEHLGTTGRRHRIEHLELTHPNDAKRLGRLGITASVQPAHSDPAILTAWPDLIGRDRCDWAFAHRDFVEHGAQLAFGTDVPTGPQKPLPIMYVANTRQSARDQHSHWKINQRQGLDINHIFGAASWGSAYSCFTEDTLGSLEVGKKADFIVVHGLTKDINADSLLTAFVSETYMDGQRVFSSS